MQNSTQTITISNHSDVLIQDVLLGVSSLKTHELEHFMFEIGKIVASRKSNHLEKQESSLLKAINNSIPSKDLELYSALLSKNQEETLTQSEHETFLALNAKIEQLSNTRLKKIITLAQLRGVSVPTLMSELNLYTNAIV